MNNNTMDSRSGKLNLIMGPMFAGKTSYILHLIETLGRATRILYINYSGDTRADTPWSTHSNVFTHDFEKLVNCTMLKVLNIEDIPENLIKEHNIIIFDESQFFNDIELIVDLVDYKNKLVYVFGLNGDSNRNNFGKIHTLIPHADDIKILRDTLCAKCIDEKKEVFQVAIFTHRLSDIKDQHLIGNDFLPVCRSHYNILNPK